MPASASGSACHTPFLLPRDPAPAPTVLRQCICTGRSARRPENVVVTLNFATTILAGKQEGIRRPSPRGAGPATRSCLILSDAVFTHKSNLLQVSSISIV